MSLPNLTIPNIPLPFDIPVLLHPAVVHFVIAIPVVILLLEIINLFFRKRALSVFSLFLILLVALFMVGAYLTGSVDGKEAYSLLSAEGQADLKEHKLLGVYLVYASLAMVLLKLLFMAFSKVVARLFFILIFIGFTVGILKQGKEGGELVYTYGANNKAIAEVQSDKEDLQDEFDELQEAYDELKESHEAKSESSSMPEKSASAEETTTSTTEVVESSENKSETSTQQEPKVDINATVTAPSVQEEQTSTTPSTESSPVSTKVEGSPVSLEIPEDTK